MHNTIVVQLDKKGRVLIPRKKRSELKLRPEDRIELEVKGVVKERPFVEKWAGSIKTKKAAVELLHEESPFR